MDGIDAYEASMEFCRYADGRAPKPRVVAEKWREAFEAIAEHIGFDEKQCRILWRDLVFGNWKRLHLTDEEGGRTPAEWLEEMRWDVIYCSDRWSFDRLTRNHWRFRAYMDACGEEWE